jgi:hypothetical protein
VAVLGQRDGYGGASSVKGKEAFYKNAKKKIALFRKAGD